MRSSFEECRFSLVKDKTLYKQLLSYGGWDLFGNLALVCQGEGVNLLLNVFFGPIVNAARAIAFQIQGAVTQFVGNFMTAVRPQVIKNYAEGNVDKMYNMTFYAAKFSYMLMLALVVPIIYEIRFITTLRYSGRLRQDGGNCLLSCDSPCSVHRGFCRDTQKEKTRKTRRVSERRKTFYFRLRLVFCSNDAYA